MVASAKKSVKKAYTKLSEPGKLPPGITMTDGEDIRNLAIRKRTSYIANFAALIKEELKDAAPFRTKRIKVDSSQISVLSLTAGLRKEFANSDINMRTTEGGTTIYVWREH